MAKVDARQRVHTSSPRSMAGSPRRRLWLTHVDQWFYGTVVKASELLTLAKLEGLEGQPVI
jgi:hypothetical protein